MKITKLNCTACGSPISIPEDINQIVCTSCGTALGIERGEGYVALKIADKLARAIESSGSQTKDAILESTAVTRSELQKLQLSQELSATQMQLNGIQAEIRTVERGSTNLMAMTQLLTLRQNEYQVMERIRTMKLQISTPAPDDLDGSLALAEWELAWIESEMAALRGSAVQRKAQLLDHLQNRSNVLSATALQIKVKKLRNRLPSFSLPDPEEGDLAGITRVLNALDQDEKWVRSQLSTLEGKVVRDDIQRRQKELRAAKKELELKRLSGELTSLNQRVNSNDLGALNEHLAQVEQDLRTVSQVGSKDLTREMQQRLQEEKKRTLRQIQELERANNRGTRPNLLGALVAGIGVGISAILADRKAAQPEQEIRTQAVEPAKFETAQTFVREDTGGDTRRGNPAYIGGGCLLAVAFLIVFFVVGVFAVGITAGDPSAENSNIAPFSFSILIGLILGTRAFLRRSASEVQIEVFGKGGLRIRPRQPGIGLQSLSAVRAIVVLSTWIGVYLLFLSIYAAIEAATSEPLIEILLISFILGPLAAWWAARHTHFVS